MFTALLTVLCIAPLSAQEPNGTIRGMVSDSATQQPLAGATVSFGARSALTTTDGRYALSGVQVGSGTLRVRMLGYTPAGRVVTVASGQTISVDLTMTAQAVNLSEIVVTGYGEQRAGDITGAVTALAPEEFNTGRIVSPAALIQSKAAGVQVVDNNEPGGGLSIRIRGATSVSASSDPLYIVDGMPLGTGSGGGLSSGRDPLNFLNPNDIESITVLRDASAAAIYGTNAANGVVLITTKSASRGGRRGTQFEYSSSASASSVTRLPSMMNATQFATAVAARAPGRVDSLLGANTDWFSQIDRTAYSQDHNLSLTGAGEATFYRLSLGYTNQDGIIRGSNTERISLGLNYDQRLLNNMLDVKVNLRGSRAADQFTPGGVLGNAAAMAPTQPVRDPTRTTGFWDWNTTNASPSNPVSALTWSTDHGTTFRSLGNVQVDYHMPFLPALRANLNLGYDVTKTDRQVFNPSFLADQVRQGQGFLSLSNNTQANQVLEGYLNYAAPLNVIPGSIDVTGGYSYTQSHAEYPYFQESRLSTDLLGDNGIPPAANVTNNKSVSDYKLISFFGRAHYNIADRYLLSVSVRRDGSSRYGPGNQWGTFPSAALAWRISGEPFMQRFAGVLSDLKLRATWAKTGNQSFGDYLWTPTYTYSDGLTQVEFGQGNFVTTIRPSGIDENIHWEATTSYDAGIDFGFNNQRFSGAIDWYTKNTSDLLFFTAVAAGTSLQNFITTNIGSMRNRGIEGSLNARILNGGGSRLGWNTTFTAAHNTNEMLSINPSQGVTSVLTGGISGGVGSQVEILRPGYPINSFFVFEQRYGANGRPIYSDTALNMYVDQNRDGVINDLDKRPFHDPAPKWILGHSSYLTYGHFDASFTLRAYMGNYVYNNVASSNGAYQNLTGSGMPSNLHTSVLTTGFVVPQYYSDFYVEDGSFLRLDNITLGYTFNFGGKPIRVYGTVQNAFTITGYSGVDPTAGLNGIDNNIYPRSRTVTTGINVRF
jgi:iron complex outermembrane receptor protein